MIDEDAGDPAISGAAETADTDEKVGYGKPPKKNRFKKGQIANANGRPKKEEPNLYDFLSNLWDEQLHTKDGTAIHNDEAFLQSVLAKALRGHSPSFWRFVELADRAKLFVNRSPKTHGILYVPFDDLQNAHFPWLKDP